jgi:hypothetical protein
VHALLPLCGEILDRNLPEWNPSETSLNHGQDIISKLVDPIFREHTLGALKETAQLAVDRITCAYLETKGLRVFLNGTLAKHPELNALVLKEMIGHILCSRDQKTVRQRASPISETVEGLAARCIAHTYLDHESLREELHDTLAANPKLNGLVLKVMAEILLFLEKNG